MKAFENGNAIHIINSLLTGLLAPFILKMVHVISFYGVKNPTCK